MLLWARFSGELRWTTCLVSAERLSVTRALQVGQANAFSGIDRERRDGQRRWPESGS